MNDSEVTVLFYCEVWLWLINMLITILRINDRIIHQNITVYVWFIVIFVLDWLEVLVWLPVVTLEPTVLPFLSRYVVVFFFLEFVTQIYFDSYTLPYFSRPSIMCLCDVNVVVNFFLRFMELHQISQEKTWPTPLPCCSVQSWCCGTWVYMATPRRSKLPALTPFGTKR